jgi:hypothetical protein
MPNILEKPPPRRLTPTDLAAIRRFADFGEDFYSGSGLA